MFCVQINNAQENIYTIRMSVLDILTVAREDYRATVQLCKYLPMFRTNLIAQFA
jgi:hypothetical protein